MRCDRHSVDDAADCYGCESERLFDRQACTYWEDGEHCYSDAPYEAGDGYHVVPKAKECRCGATVKPKEGR